MASLQVKVQSQIKFFDNLFHALIMNKKIIKCLSVNSLVSTELFLLLINHVEGIFLIKNNALVVDSQSGANSELFKGIAQNLRLPLQLAITENDCDEDEKIIDVTGDSDEEPFRNLLFQKRHGQGSCNF